MIDNVDNQIAVAALNAMNDKCCAGNMTVFDSVGTGLANGQFDFRYLNGAEAGPSSKSSNRAASLRHGAGLA